MARSKSSFSLPLICLKKTRVLLSLISFLKVSKSKSKKTLTSYQPSLSPENRRIRRPRRDKSEMRRGTWVETNYIAFVQVNIKQEFTWKADRGIVA